MNKVFILPQQISLCKFLLLNKHPTQNFRGKMCSESFFQQVRRIQGWILLKLKWNISDGFFSSSSRKYIFLNKIQLTPFQGMSRLISKARAVCPPRAWIHTLQCRGMLLICLRIVTRLISCQTSLHQGIGELMDCPGCFASHRMRWSMISQRCPMGFRSGEGSGQSIVSMPSSS